MKKESGLDICRGSAWPLGVSKTAKGINFAVISEKKEPFVLKITAGEKNYEIPMNEFHVIGSIYAVRITGIKSSYLEYEYVCGGIKLRDDYAAGIADASAWGEVRADKKYCFWNKNFNWEDDRRPKIACHELVMYKLHVRGFTKQPSSKVRHRGTFLGAAQKAEYLKSLGINCVELMPAVEFDEMMPENDNLYVIPGKQPEKYKMNYWGYGEAYYFAPKAAYAYGRCPQEEFKTMVKAFHKAGIEVIMEFAFTEKTNKNLIVDCLRFWTTQYHVDGFHLSSNTVPMTLLMSDAVLSEVKLFSEYFDNQGSGKIPSYKRLAVYHDEYEICCRRFLKGDEDMVRQFVNLLTANDYDRAFVRYLSNHNGMRLYDIVSYDMKHNEANGENNKDGTDYNYSWNCGVEGATRRRKILELRKRQIKNAWVFTLIHQGIPLIYAGDEFGHTQEGNNNAYCLDNEISWLNWKLQNKNKELFDFVRELLDFRAKHPILHQEKPMRMMDYLSCGYPDFSMHGILPWKPETMPSSRYIGLMYCGKYAHFGGREDDFIYMAYNMYWEKKEVHLPILPKNLEWVCAINTFGTEKDDAGVKTCIVPPRTIEIFVSREKEA